MTVLPRRHRATATAAALATLGALVAVPAAAVAAPAGTAGARGDRPTAVASAGARGDVAASLDWRPCPDQAGVECARLVVSLDRRHPAAGTVRLALARHRATGDAAQRIGSLVYDPGGPGGSGVSSLGAVWSHLPAAVQARFDLVGWDPRGVGASTPALVGCATPWPARPASGPVAWSDVVTRYTRVLAAANARCQARNAGLVEHMGTMEAVEDLDRIREALGEARLTYWGMSYGTRIGYVYALRYPQHVRAMVLDGSIDPAGTLLGLAEGGAAPDQAYGVFAAAQPTAAASLPRVLAALERAPLRLPDGSRFDRWALIDIVFNNIAQQAAYPALAAVVAAAATAVDDTGAARTEATRSLQQLRTLTYASNSNAGSVFSVVNCLDYPQRPTLAQSIAAVRAQVRLGPYWGGTLTTQFAVGCAGLRLQPDPVPVVTGIGPRVPVLITGSTRDGSTIVQWTARMARAFPASRTVTYAGGQHVVFGLAGSACVNTPVTRYLLTTRLPAMDLACPNVVVPN